MDKKLDKNDYYVVDVLHILKSLWNRAWAIAVSAILAAGIGFSIAAFAIAPTYSSSIMLYINNSSVSLDDIGVSLTSSDISAAQSLVKTYSVLLKNRTTLEQVGEKAGVSYEWEELDDMIAVSSVNETEVMQVTVTATDPYEAEKIANGIAVVLRQRVTEIVEGTSMEIVDSAVANLDKVAPSVTQYTALGGVIGILVSVIILVVLALMDNTIHDEEYILQNYDYPILAKVPNLLDAGSKKYGYRYEYYKKESKNGGDVNGN